jgi:hypothetical protein
VPTVKQLAQFETDRIYTLVNEEMKNIIDGFLNSTSMGVADKCIDSIQSKSVNVDNEKKCMAWFIKLWSQIPGYYGRIEKRVMLYSYYDTKRISSSCVLMLNYLQNRTAT